MEELFRKWLHDNKNLSNSSVEKYIRAIRAVSRDMNEEGLYDFDLYSLSSSEQFYSLKNKIIENLFLQKKIKKETVCIV